MMKALVEYSNPDFLTFDSATPHRRCGNPASCAMATMWGSRGGAILDDEGSSEAVTGTTALVGAPTWGGGDTPGLNPVVGWLDHCQEHLG